MTGRPLRFCMITTFYPPYSFGGDGEFVRMLSQELARRGHHVEVIHCGDTYRALKGSDPESAYDEQENVTIHRLESPYGILSPLATQQTGRAFFKSRRIREVLDRGFDVIHYHNISAVGGPEVMAFGDAVKLYTIHDYWLVCPTHMLFKYNRATCQERDCISCTLAHLRPPQWWRYSSLLERMVPHVDRFITPSRFGAEIHRRMGFDVPFVHLPHFVPPTEAPSPAARPSVADAETPYFLFVGRLEKIKGLQTLIPLFRGRRDARLLVAGTGAYEPELRRLAADLPNVEFLGYEAGERLRSLNRNAVAVIVPSVCYELLSLVILEAFREGTPVITRNIGGMPELVEASGGGIVFDTDEQLGAAIARLLNDAVDRARLGAAGCSAYRRQWSPDAHIARYLAIIDEVRQ